jgi:hypothetical protein
MKRASISTMAAMALLVSSILGGCVTTRKITRLDEHPTQPVLLLETLDRTYLLGAPISASQVFWQCVERNGALACQRQCGGDREFACPTLTQTSGGATSNVR